MHSGEALRYVDHLFRYAMALSRNGAEAEDLVQETYVRALKAMDSLRPNSNLKVWMFTILRNEWRNQLRKQRTGPRALIHSTGPNTNGRRRGPRTWPWDQVTAAPGASANSGNRPSHSSRATVISMRARFEPIQR
jgi:RNA polymerase sigma factor (sigma-70 family)